MNQMKSILLIGSNNRVFGDLFRCLRFDDWGALREKLMSICCTFEEQKDLLAFDENEVMAYINRLQQALAEMDIDTSDEIVSILKQYEYDENWKPMMEKVYQAAFNLSEEELRYIISEKNLRRNTLRSEFMVQ